MPDVPDPAPSRWTWKRLLLAGGLGGLLVLGAGVGRLLYVNRGDLAKAARIVRERNERRRIPDEGNARFLYERIAHDFVPMPDELVTQLNPAGRPDSAYLRVWSPAAEPDLAAWVAMNEGLLPRLRERPAGYFVEWSPSRSPMEIRLDSVFARGNWTRWATYHALREDDRGLADRWDLLGEVYRVNAIGSRGFLIESLVSNAACGITLTGMERTLMGWPPAVPEARDALVALDRLREEATLDLEISFEEDQDAMQAALEHLYSVGIFESAPDVGPIRWMVWKPSLEAEMETLYGEIVRRARARPSDAVHRTPPLSSGPTSFREVWSGRALAREWMGYHRDSIPKQWRTEARFDALRLLVACHGYRAEHGDFPAALADLVPSWIPALPKDPFTDADFLCRREPDGTIRIWSVGPDYTDNGADEDADVVVGCPE